MATGMADAKRRTMRCPLCDEALAVGVPGPAPACPFDGEAGCPLASSGEPAGPINPEDSLQATIAYRPGGQSGSHDDGHHGFPDEDDLVDRPLGQYRIGPVIGNGTMGRVYQALHSGLGRQCAIKVMNPGLVARQPHVVERFWAEARAVAGLVHPHVVTVHNLGSDRGYHYIEMEFVPGGVSLKETVVRGGALEPVRATQLVRQVALALGAAHRAGLVHRDVKPANVLLTADSRAKLADFGLVRRLADGEGVGAPLAGTPTFMAPELFAGAPASPRSDLYAVGVMYYYLLTARLPYSSDNLGTLIKLHRKAPVPDVRQLAPAVPDEVAEILASLLAKDPNNRPESADELAELLRTILGHLRDTEGLVRESLQGIDCFIQQSGRDRFRVVLPVAGDRIQEVYLEVLAGRDGERLLAIYSVCAPADPKHYEFALKLNAKLTLGSLSIRDFNGQPMFVMARSFPRAHASPSDIRAAVQEIATRGDRVELELSGTDIF